MARGSILHACLRNKNDLMYVEIKNEYMSIYFFQMKCLRHWLYLKGINVINRTVLRKHLYFHSFPRTHALEDRDVTRRGGGGQGAVLTQLLFDRRLNLHIIESLSLEWVASPIS